MVRLNSFSLSPLHPASLSPPSPAKITRQNYRDVNVQFYLQSFNLVTTAWAKGLAPLLLPLHPTAPPPPKKKKKNTRKSYRDVKLPSNLNSFIIKEETKIELNILTILPVPPPPPPHPHTHTQNNKNIKRK